MAILSKGNTFATGDQVTALKLNNLVDNSTFASGAVDDSTTQLDGSGRIIVKDGGITSAKLNLSATGASQNIATFKTTQTHDSGTVGRSLDIRTPASTTDINSPFEIHTDNAIQFIVDDHTVTIDSDGKTKFGTGNIESTNTSLFQVNINTDAVLGTTAGNEQGILRLVEQAGNTDNLLFTSVRTADGSDWTTAAHRIQRKVDSTKMGFIQFGHHTATNGNTITFGEDETERMRIDAEGHVGIGTTTPSEALEVAGKIIATDGTDFVELVNTGAIELRAAAGPFIDFKDGDEDRDCRIGQSSNGFIFQVGGSSAVATKLQLTSDGLVQINGANSDGDSILRLETSGDSDTSALQFGDTSSDNIGQIGYVHTDDSMRFTVNASERLRIDSSGDVGIGTVNPETAIHIENTSENQITLTNNSGDFSRIRSKRGLVLAADFDTDSGAQQSFMAFETDNAERIRIIAGGDVGIGTTSPDTKLHVKGTDNSNPVSVTIENAGTNQAALKLKNSERTFSLESDDDQFRIFDSDESATRFQIHSDGAIRIGTTTETAYGAKTFIQNDVSDANACLTLRHVQTGDRTMMAFVVGSDVVGRINEASGTISLVQGSDYRLKEDIIDMDTAVDKVKLLKPRNYALKKNGVRFDGFIAHELAEVCPQAVFGEKDAMRMEPYEGGTREVEDHQGIDPTKLVPLLTKALQEALTKIESLEARVAVLES